jgi:hypothetical protein
MTMMNEMDAQVQYIEHQRRMQVVNEEAWKYELAQRPLRAAAAKALLALARRIAPPAPEMDRATDALAR